MNSTGIYIALFLSGSLLGSAATSYYQANTGQLVLGFDHNADGILDERLIGVEGSPQKVMIDRNFDGSDDYIMFFLTTGHVSSSTSDDDFDGIFETESSFVNNQPSAVRVDSDGDGDFDLIQYFTYGVASESFIKNPATGLKERKHLYKLGKISKTYKDTNSNGVFDLECIYDFFQDETCNQLATPISNDGKEGVGSSE